MGAPHYPKLVQLVPAKENKTPPEKQILQKAEPSVYVEPGNSGLHPSLHTAPAPAAHLLPTWGHTRRACLPYPGTVLESLQRVLWEINKPSEATSDVPILQIRYPGDPVSLGVEVLCLTLQPWVRCSDSCPCDT